MKINIAFLQVLPGKNLEENLIIGKKACVEAKEKNADIAIFPEMWSDGYLLPQEEGEVESLAIEKDSEFICEFRKLAKELQMAIGVTFLEKHNPKPLNSVVFLTVPEKKFCIIQKYILVHLTWKKYYLPEMIFMLLTWILAEVRLRLDL